MLDCATGYCAPTAAAGTPTFLDLEVLVQRGGSGRRAGQCPPEPHGAGAQAPARAARGAVRVIAGS